MEPHDNVAIIRDLYKRWVTSSGKDSDAFLEVMHDDVVYESVGGGRVPYVVTSTVNRKSALGALFDYIRNEIEFVDYVIEDIVGQGDVVFALIESTMRIRETGHHFRSKKCNAFWFRDGKIARYEIVYDTLALYTSIGKAA